MDDKIFIREALKEAKLAFMEGEAPIGAVIVKDNKIIGKGHNRRENDKNATLHAEIVAINEACKNVGSWRLHDSTMYVTLEPCPMCAGAIVNSRIDRVVFCAKDSKAGAFGSVLDLNSYPLNHKVKCECGLCENESLSMLSMFFKNLRK